MESFRRTSRDDLWEGLATAGPPARLGEDSRKQLLLPSSLSLLAVPKTWVPLPRLRSPPGLRRRWLYAPTLGVVCSAIGKPSALLDVDG